MSKCPASPALDLGKGDFTLAVWVHTEESLDDVLGDLVSKYDPAARRGLNWCIKSGAGMTNSQANDRNVQFGIDAGTEPVWSDRGRPGNAVYVMAMAVHDGKLFVGTCEAGPGEAGHVYRYDGGSRWVDCGSPDRCNAVTSLAASDGKLYAGTGRYRLAGSALARVDEREPRAARSPATTATATGPTAVGCPTRRPWAGWSSSAASSTPRRCTSRPASSATEGATPGSAAPCPPTAAGSSPSASSMDISTRGRTTPAPSAGSTARAGRPSGVLESTGQTYSFEVHAGELFVGTWPNGQVFRFDRGERWVSAGRLGEEKEVMGMAVHNGKLYAGTLPLAEVYRLDDGTRWTRTGRLDLTPDVRYRRAWSMAVFDGRLFCGTLPSGRVHAPGGRPERDPRPRARARLEAPRRPSARGDGSPSSSTGRASRRRPRSNRPAPGPDQRATAADRLRGLRPFPRQSERPPPLRPGTLGRRDRRPDGTRRQGLSAVGGRRSRWDSWP